MSNIANLFSHIMTLIGLNHYNKTESDNKYAEKSHSHNNYLTSQNITGKEDTSNKVTSWSSTTTDAHYPSEKLVKSTLDSKLDTATATETYQPKNNYALSNHTHTTGSITDFPSIPSASSTTPSADTANGSVGSGTTWAKADHTHPKSTLYAEASHNHTISNLTNVTTVSVVVTYTDNTTETINLLKYTGS